MHILITGNLGYVGPLLVQHVRSTYPSYRLSGFDLGLFSHLHTQPLPSADTLLDTQYYGDVRSFDPQVLQGVDAVIYLAAISNDPMGNRFEKPTLEINHESAIRWAEAARSNGVKQFVFASSCSVYGQADTEDRDENSAVNPLTAYARSKVYAENDLRPLANENFTVTCLRFATACGMSSRLRLDLVLNDFVASALVSGRIEILSDGTPWRPLIHVADMARAMDWAMNRRATADDQWLVVNAGSNAWNMQVKQLALEVQKKIAGTEVFINPEGQPDKRSYKVNFNRFLASAPHHQPVYTPEKTIEGLIQGLTQMKFADNDFRNSRLMRLYVLNELIRNGWIDQNLQRIL